MTSTFTWLDSSEKQRSQMLDVINLFGNEKETRDELGIGTVRDTFADLFFPGTSTIQTRAKYFLFVPWIYSNLERTRVPSDKFAYRARVDEIYLINALYKNGATVGLIGIDARASLKRMPSAIYWSGLGAWGIRQYPGPISGYRRSLDGFYAANRRVDEFHRENRGEDAVNEMQLRQGTNWHQGVRELRPKDFITEATFDLTREEARYLQEQIIRHQPDSLLAFLAVQANETAETSFPWEHPALTDLPEHLQEQLYHARCFSLTIHGAALLYNLMLAEKKYQNSSNGPDTQVDSYRQALAEWAAEMMQANIDLSRWDWQDRFWKIVAGGNPRLPTRTRQFVDSWLGLALQDNPAAIADQPAARQLIQAREWRLKGKLARLTNPRTLELWGGAAGTGRLNYRWRVAQTMLSDIWQGLSHA